MILANKVVGERIASNADGHGFPPWFENIEGIATNKQQTKQPKPIFVGVALLLVRKLPPPHAFHYL